MDTIKSSTEISQLFSTGKRYKTRYVTFIVGDETSAQDRGNEAQHDLPGRVAFIAGKKLGNAVWRNQAKRRMRALCREMGGPWAGKKVVFLAKGALTQAPYGKVLGECEGIARKFSSSEEAR